MGRPPLYKFQSKRNGLLKDVPESQTEKVGCGIVTNTKLMTEKKQKCYSWS